MVASSSALLYKFDYFSTVFKEQIPFDKFTVNIKTVLFHFRSTALFKD